MRRKMKSWQKDEQKDERVDEEGHPYVYSRTISPQATHPVYTITLHTDLAPSFELRLNLWLRRRQLCWAANGGSY